MARFALFPRFGRRFVGWWAGLALLGLACTLSISPQGARLDTGAATATTAAAPSAGETAAPTTAVPAAGPPALPALQPTPVPTARGRALSPPTPAPGAAQPVTGGPVRASEIWDFPTGDYADRQARGPYTAWGGDRYDFNLYERPFTERTQEAFYPDLDIRYARLVQAGDWFFAVLRLHGLPPNAAGPTGDYGVELDPDLDGQGEILVWARGPIPRQWTAAGVEVRRDPNGDVEGPRVCRSDAPLRTNGYEQVRYQTTPDTALAWLRWDYEAEGNRTYPAVYIAFHRSLLDGQDQRFLWLAWADGGRRAPGQMTYHDTYTLPQAGEPCRDAAHYPIQALARMDNTCRAAFGFEPTGLEPCLCENDTTVALCPAPEQGPGPQCYLDETLTTWVCPAPEATATAGPYDELPPAGSASAGTFYCTWDPELCRWSCRPERVCLPPNADEAGARVTPGLEGQSGDACYVTPNGLLCLPGDGGSPPTLPGPGLAPSPTPPVLPGPGFGNSGDPLPTPIPEPSPGGWIVDTPQGRQVCEWDPNLCRWQCREEQCVVTEPGPNCLPAIDGTYTCTWGDEITFTEVCRWDPATCRWDCRPTGECQAPAEGPGAMCEAQGDGRWFCTSEIGTQVCTWDTGLCQWDCETDVCSQPDATCTLYEDDEVWVCPGKGEFGGCRWDTAQCRWVCWDPIQPEPEPEPGDETCQAEDACSLDGDEWYCEFGGPYASCEYDGCTWDCQ